MEIGQKIHIQYLNSLDLDPKDFTNCNTIGDLKQAISKKFNEVFKYKNVVLESFSIPEDFIEEWKKLVKFLPNNIMTIRKKEEILKNNKIYILEYSGEYLNYIKNQYKLSLQIGDYKDFYFNDKKNYKCYIVDDRNSSVLLFAEEKI